MQYDEISYGKAVKENGFQGDNLTKDLVILSKYLCHIDGLKPKAHKDFVYDFCKKNIYDFNEVKHYKTIDSCIRKGRDKHCYPIRIKSIPIYEEILKKIDSYDVADDYKKVMLSMYLDRIITKEKKSQRLRCGQDLNLCYYGNNKTNKLVYNSSRIGSTYKIKNVLRDLNKNGVIHDVGRNRIILKFAENINDEKIFHNLQSCDFDKVGWLWDLYKKKNNIIRCKDCDVMVRIKLRSKTTRCSVCQYIEDNKNKRKWDKNNK